MHSVSKGKHNLDSVSERKHNLHLIIYIHIVHSSSSIKAKHTQSACI
jgi:hypothetical protein